MNEIIRYVEEKDTQHQFVGNWGPYDYPLACRIIKSTDAKILYPVLKRSSHRLAGFIDWARNIQSWNMATAERFVQDHVNSPPPRFHLIFTIGYEVVGFGSLAPMPNPRDIQVSLFVAEGFEGQGIGSWIVTVLEWYAFHVFGFDNCYYQHAVGNMRSGNIAKRNGFKFSHIFKYKTKAWKEIGYWVSYKKSRPKGLPPGSIDTKTTSNWNEVTLPWKCLI